MLLLSFYHGIPISLQLFHPSEWSRVGLAPSPATWPRPSQPPKWFFTVGHVAEVMSFHGIQGKLSISQLKLKESWQRGSPVFIDIAMERFPSNVYESQIFLIVRKVCSSVLKSSLCNGRSNRAVSTPGIGPLWFVEFQILWSFHKFLGSWNIRIEGDIKECPDFFKDKSMEEEDIMHWQFRSLEI